MAFAPPAVPSPRTPFWLVVLVLQALFSIAVGMTMAISPNKIFSIMHPPQISSLEPSQRFVAEEVLRWFGLLMALQGLTWLRLRKNKGIVEVLLVAFFGELAFGFLFFKFTETFGQITFNLHMVAYAGVSAFMALIRLFTIFGARRYFNSFVAKKTT